MINVLIDDDRLIHLSWKMYFNKKGLELLTFYSAQDFLNAKIPPVDIETIYIDSDLGNGERGELASKEFYEKGYRNIILTTGYEDIDLKKHPWLTKIMTKNPPK